MLALLAGTRTDRVLCKGLDGHVAVERAVNGACADDGRALGVPGVGLLPVHHCGPCIDVPLLGDPMNRAVLTPGIQVPNGGVFTPTATYSPDSPAGGPGLWMRSLHRFSLPPDRVSPVVLRI